MSLVDQAVFDKYIRDEVGLVDATIRAQALASAEAKVKSYCGGGGWRTFDLTASSATARVYGPPQISSCGTVLRVHDFCDTTGLIVVNNGTTIASTDYQLEPVNGYTVTGEAYTQIRLTSGAWWYYSPYGKATASITAKWGWTAVPAAVVEVVKQLGKSEIQRRDTTLGLITTAAGPAFGTGDRATLAALDAQWRRGEAYGV